MAGDLLNKGLLGSGDAQADIKAHVDALPSVLEQENIMDVLDWTADYALMTSRVKEPEEVDMYFASVLEQLKSYGYGENDDDASPTEQSALSLIANTIGRMESGLVPTGYERVFADQLEKEAQGTEPDVATPV